MMYRDYYWSTFEKDNICYMDPGEESTVRDDPPAELRGLPMMVTYRHDRKHKSEEGAIRFSVNQEIDLYILCHKNEDSWMGTDEGWTIDAGWPNTHTAYRRTYQAGTIDLPLNDGSYFCVVDPKGTDGLVLSKPQHIRAPYDVSGEGFHRDIEPFIDESETFDDMSSQAQDSLGGLTVIRTRDGDRRVCGTIFRFTTDEDVTLYTVACADREQPDWLDDWDAKTSWDMHIRYGGYGEDMVPMAKDVPAGTHVFESWRIPGNSSSGEGRMYFVVVKGKATTQSTPPVVSISSPGDGDDVSLDMTTTITAEADDDGTVEEVQFYAGNRLVGTDTDGSDGWSVAWEIPRNDVHDIVTISPNTIELAACAVDNRGARAFSEGVSVNMVDESDISAVRRYRHDIHSCTKTPVMHHGQYRVFSVTGRVCPAQHDAVRALTPRLRVPKNNRVNASLFIGRQVQEKEKSRK
jgi:hypothetical protein